MLPAKKENIRISLDGFIGEMWREKFKMLILSFWMELICKLYGRMEFGNMEK